MLEFFGIQVYAIESGGECDALLAQVTPTLVITDLAMPGVDGWEALAIVRDNPATAAIPVVAVTSYHSARLEDEAINGGFDAYFPKPLDAASFVQDLDALISA
jgi:CheY-like chemotaxis protein